MLTHLVMLVRGWAGYPFTARSLLTAEQVLQNAKPLLVKSTQASPQAVRNPHQSAQQLLSKKQKAVSQISAVKESQSKKPKLVATDKQLSTRGKSIRTPALLTPQAVKPAPKVKRSLAK
jgi:hypothetical protein